MTLRCTFGNGSSTWELDKRIFTRAARYQGVLETAISGHEALVVTCVSYVLQRSVRMLP